jgi:hypothetical protein
MFLGCLKYQKKIVIEKNSLLGGLKATRSKPSVRVSSCINFEHFHNYLSILGVKFQTIFFKNKFIAYQTFAKRLCKDIHHMHKSNMAEMIVIL